MAKRGRLLRVRSGEFSSSKIQPSEVTLKEGASKSHPKTFKTDNALPTVLGCMQLKKMHMSAHLGPYTRTS